MTSRLSLLVLALLAACAEPDAPTEPEAAPDAPTALFEAWDVELGAIVTGRDDVPTILEVNGGGLALFDADGDDDLDVLLVSPGAFPDGRAPIGASNRLLRNDGGGRFVDVTDGSGVDVAAWCNGVAIADVDADGDRDVYLTCLGANVLLRNDGALRFTRLDDAAGAAGASDDWSTSALFVDLDADGDQDLYVVNYLAFDPTDPPMHGVDGLSCLWKGMPVMCGPQGLEAQRDRVFENDGGRFVEVSDAWGFDGPPAYGLGVIDGDFNGDGRLDVYVTNDSVANFLYLSQPDGGHVEGGVLSGAVLSARGREQAGMGVSVGDAEGDGDEDLLVTNFSMESNALYVQGEGGVFTDTADRVGIGGASRQLLGWGVAFVDADLDGDEDVVAANGHVYVQADAEGTDTTYAQPDLLMLNDGAGRFARAPWPGETPSASRALAVGDLDDDHVADVVVTRRSGETSCWRGTASPAGALQVVVRGPPGNPDDVGALVTWRDARGAQVRRVRASAGYQAYGDPRPLLAFGGPGTLEVRHPDGRVSRGEVTRPGRVIVERDGSFVVRTVDAPSTSAPVAPTASGPTSSPATPAELPEAAPLSASDRALLGEAVRAMGEQRYEDVGDVLAPLLARDVVHAEVQFVAGSAAYELQRYGEAAERLGEAAARERALLVNSSALGFARLRLGDHDGARAAFAAIVDADPTKHKAHYGLGLVALEVGSEDEAAAHVARALELSPRYAKARFARARLAERAGDFDAALDDAYAVVGDEPLHAEALLLAARCLAALGQDADAEAVLARREQVYAVNEAVGGLRQRIAAGEASADVFVELIALYEAAGAGRAADDARREAAARFPGEAARFGR